MSTTQPSSASHPATHPEREPATFVVAPGGESTATRPGPTGPRRALFVTIGILAAVAAAVLGLRFWSYSHTHVSTDDAQVDGYVIPVLARVSGYVQAVPAVENQRVEAGSVLVVLDPSDLDAKLRQAEADLAVALAGAGPTGQYAADLHAAQSAVSDAEAQAEKADLDLTRLTPLFDQGVISHQQFDDARTAATRAHATLAAARQRVESAAAQTRSADAKVAAARAARDAAALQRSYTRVTAPRTGVLSRVNVDSGQLVQAGQPLLAVVPLDDVWVTANLKETQLEHVHPGQPAAIEADAYPGRIVPGHVESISPATGAQFSLLPPDNATGNFVKVVQRVPVRVALDRPNDPRHPLRPGMSVHVAIRTGP